MNSWLDMFRDTITCPSCKGHFTEMLDKYRSIFPNMLESRQEFAVFTFRAHNAVNRRLNKPLYASLGECMDTLRKNIVNRSARDYRVSYINHATRYWRTQQDVTGIVATKKMNEMRKIEIDYIATRDTNFNVDLRPDVVVLPSDAMERIQQSTAMRPRVLPTTRVGFQLSGGGFRLRR